MGVAPDSKHLRMAIAGDRDRGVGQGGKNHLPCTEGEETSDGRGGGLGDQGVNGLVHWRSGGAWEDEDRRAFAGQRTRQVPGEKMDGVALPHHLTSRSHPLRPLGTTPIHGDTCAIHDTVHSSPRNDPGMLRGLFFVLLGTRSVHPIPLSGSFLPSTGSQSPFQAFPIL